ncbi:MAG: hypothetical protein L0H83_07785 [Salinisphaera sp.]|nr:hypothetical protein [Salinisphaera sp.]
METGAIRVRTLLWASLVLVPAALIAEFLGVDDTVLFILSALALMPLAWLIGEATEQLGEHVGPAIAGLLNASFGNAPELIISLFAISEGLFEVVRGSLVGSVIGNLLLVLGCSLAVGGEGKIGKRTALESLSMVALALLLFGLSSAVGYGEAGGATLFWATSILAAVVLLCVYVVATARSMMREYREKRESGETGQAAWSLPITLMALGAATLATVGVSQELTSSIKAFSASVGWSDLFVAIVVVAIAGNAAEHGGAVVIAAKGNVRLAAEIGLQSSAQVAVGLIPVVLLLSLVINPLALVFAPAELLGMAVATVLPAALLYRGVSSRARGLVLCGAYLGLVVMYFVLTA